MSLLHGRASWSHRRQSPQHQGYNSTWLLWTCLFQTLSPSLALWLQWWNRPRKFRSSLSFVQFLLLMIFVKVLLSLLYNQRGYNITKTYAETGAYLAQYLLWSIVCWGYFSCLLWLPMVLWILWADALVDFSIAKSITIYHSYSVAVYSTNYIIKLIDYEEVILLTISLLQVITIMKIGLSGCFSCYPVQCTMQIVIVLCKHVYM